MIRKLKKEAGMQIELVVGDPRGSFIPTSTLRVFKGEEARGAAKAFGRIGQTITLTQETKDAYLGANDGDESKFNHGTFSRMTVVAVNVPEPMNTMTVYVLPMQNVDAEGKVKPGGMARTPETSTIYLDWLDEALEGE